jgi:flagellar motor switch/type III secretory pathway protein FliN
MTGTVSYWLPPGARPPAALQRKLETLIEDWSRAWIIGPPLRTAGLQPAAVRINRRSFDRIGTRGVDGCAALQIGEDAKLRLGLIALGVDLDPGSLTPADLDLIGLLAGDMMADFERRFALFARLPAAGWDEAGAPTQQGQDVMMIEIGETSGAPLFRVTLSPAMFADLVRDSLPAVRPRPLGQGGAALARTPVSVAAMLGRGTVSLADLEALDVGDVIVLDRAAGAPLPLAVNGVETGLGRCRVTGTDATLALEMTAALAGAVA